MRRVLFVSVLAALLLGACDDEPIQVGRGMGGAGGGAAQATPPAADPGAAEAGPDAGPPVVSYRDEDFVEADSNRDPFRNYAASFQVAPEPTERAAGRPVTMPDTSIEEMRLIGIISGVADPRAMIVDREGVGHTVRRGEYIGRSEIVQTGGTDALPVELNWRVDRIRPNEVVLTREDPTAPNRPPLTRVLPLRDEDPRLEQAIRSR